MHYAADLREFAIEQGVGIQVARGPQRAIHYAAVQVRYHQVLRAQLLVGHTARLDRHQRFGPRPVDPAHVAERVRCQSAACNLQVGLKNLFA